MYTRLTFIIGLVCLSVPVVSQPLDFHKWDTTDQNRTYPVNNTLELRLHYGGHVETGVPLLNQTVEANPFYAFDFRYGWKGYGRKAWQQLYKFPTYGFGWYQALFIPVNNQLGNPSAVYFFFNQPLWLNSKVTLGYELQFGLSYNFIAYDPVHNPDQYAIGSPNNVHAGVMLEARFPLSQRLDATAGLGFVHFSNGRSRTPQRGVNLGSLTAALKYNLAGRYHKPYKNLPKSTPRPEQIYQQLPEYKSRWEYYGFANVGVATPESKEADRNIYYFMASIGADAAYHYSHRGKAGLGVDWFYDASLSEKYMISGNEVPFEDKNYFGIHIGHELMIHRWTLVTQVGIPVIKPAVVGSWYGRAALRYDVTKNFFIRGGLKIPDGFKADWIEWGCGFYFYRIKQ